jgi:hypothetical protein
MAGKHVRRRQGRVASLRNHAGRTLAVLAVSATGIVVPLALTSGTPAGADGHHCEGTLVLEGNALHPSEVCVYDHHG